jgi:HK97 family phage major capsid protein
MKKNPLFIANSNANKNKRKQAFKILGLSMFLLFAISFITTASVRNNVMDAIEFLTCTGISVGSLAFVPMLAGIRGTMKDNLIDESDAEFAARGGKAEDPEKYFARYCKYLEGEILVAKDNPAVKKELETLKTTLDAMKGQSELINALKEEVKKANLKIESALEKQSSEQKKDIVAQLTDWREANKAALESIRGGHKAELKPFVVKLNSPMTPSNTFNSSAYLPIPEFLPGAVEIVRVQPTFADYLNWGRSSSATLVWVNKKNPEGAAGFIGPGVAKPGVSLELATETSVAKKIAVSSKVATELLEDIEGFASYIQLEMRYQLRIKLNAELMTGTVSSTVPAGIQTISTTYTLSGVATTDPNNWDAIRAAVAQLRSGNLVGPVTVFVNPVDKANMDLTKAQSQGQLFQPADPGATIVEDNNIAVGYFQAAILPYYQVRIYKDFSVAFGWEDDDFTKNLVTSIAEMRIHQFFSENHTGAFIYDTFDNVKTAIALP